MHPVSTEDMLSKIEQAQTCTLAFPASEKSEYKDNARGLESWKGEDVWESSLLYPSKCTIGHAAM